jgi:hypothetical protein
MSKLLAILLVLASSTQASAALVIRADATGYVPAFWGVQFVSGDGYIQSVKITLPSPNYFDFGTASQG